MSCLISALHSRISCRTLECSESPDKLVETVFPLLSHIWALSHLPTFRRGEGVCRPFPGHWGVIYPTHCLLVITHAAIPDKGGSLKGLKIARRRCVILVLLLHCEHWYKVKYTQRQTSEGCKEHTHQHVCTYKKVQRHWQRVQIHIQYRQQAQDVATSYCILHEAG